MPAGVKDEILLKSVIWAVKSGFGSLTQSPFNPPGANISYPMGLTYLSVGDGDGEGVDVGTEVGVGVGEGAGVGVGVGKGVGVRAAWVAACVGRVVGKVADVNSEVSVGMSTVSTVGIWVGEAGASGVTAVSGMSAGA